MTRIALVIANSVTSQPTQKGWTPPKVRRAAEQVASLFKALPDEYAFDARVLFDEKPQVVRRELDKAAKACSDHNSLLLIYYFGHGVRERNDLAFVHPGKQRDIPEFLPFENVFYTIRAHKPKRVIFLLDCCYAGAAGNRIAQLPEQGYCLLACTTASTRALWEDRSDTPIGFFTAALLDGFTNPAAAVSPADDDITSESLFAFLSEETRRLTENAQEPYKVGQLDEALSTYSETPTVVEGITEGVSPKSAYSKLRLIVTVIGRKKYPDLHTLYDDLLQRDRKVFLTNYLDKDGRISQRPAHWTVLRKYMSFLRTMLIVDEEELRLTPRGLELIEHPEEDYNSKLLVLLDRYLANHSLSRDDLKSTMQRVLQRRWLPTRGNVLGELILVKRYLNEQHLGMLMDLLGYIGVIGTLRRKEQVYFPWGSIPARKPEIE